MQIQFKNMTIYDCGPTYNPKHPESNPACTRVTNIQDTLRLQVSHYALAPKCMHDDGLLRFLCGLVSVSQVFSSGYPSVFVSIVEVVPLRACLKQLPCLNACILLLCCMLLLVYTKGCPWQRLQTVCAQMWLHALNMASFPLLTFCKATLCPKDLSSMHLAKLLCDHKITRNMFHLHHWNVTELMVKGRD